MASTIKTSKNQYVEVENKRETKPVRLSNFVEHLQPYSPISSQQLIRENTSGETPYKLDWNEATIPPSPKVTAAITHYLQHGPGLNWYPELASRTLLNKLTAYTGLSSNYLLATSGSDDALSLLCACFIDPGDDVVVPAPTYNHFIVFAQAHGGNLVEVTNDDIYTINIDSLRAVLTPTTRFVYIVSPNNPTGSIISNADIAQLCEDFEETLFLLDEAYFEFAQYSGIRLVQTYKNLIVTRTFSKAFGLAGLRIGYLAAHPELIGHIGRLYNPKSVNSLAQVAAAAALDDLDYLYKYIEGVNKSKQMLADFFKNYKDLEVHLTPANFIIIRCGDAKKTIEQLASRNIYVRDRSDYYGLEGCFRMSIGTVEQTQEIIERLKEIL